MVECPTPLGHPAGQARGVRCLRGAPLVDPCWPQPAIVIAVATQPGFPSRAPEIVVWMAAYVVAWVRAYLPIAAVIIVGPILIALSIRRRQNRI